MEEQEVVAAVKRWLKSQGFVVRDDILIDELGRAVPQHRFDRPEPEKCVLGWAEAFPRGASLEDMNRGPSNKIPRKELEEAVSRLVELGELEKRRGKLFLRTGPRSEVPRLPCPVRPDLYAFRSKNRKERWTVECQGTGGAISHAIGQAYLHAKVSNRAFLALPSDWPKLDTSDKREHLWALMGRLAREQGFSLLRVTPKGSVSAV